MEEFKLESGEKKVPFEMRHVELKYAEAHNACRNCINSTMETHAVQMVSMHDPDAYSRGPMWLGLIRSALCCRR
jgi:hypothetical protein